MSPARCRPRSSSRRSLWPSQPDRWPRRRTPAAATTAARFAQDWRAAAPRRRRTPRTRTRTRRTRRTRRGRTARRAQGPDDELDGSYTGEVVTPTRTRRSKPTAQPVTAFEMPFPCGEAWTGTTRASHSPSARSVDFNRTDDFGDPVVAAAAGVVTTAVTGKKRPSYGQFVVIDHGNDESHALRAPRLGDRDGRPGASRPARRSARSATPATRTARTCTSRSAQGSSVIDSWFNGSRYAFGTAQASKNCGEITIPDVPLAGNVVGSKRADLVVFRRTGKPAVLRPPRAEGGQGHPVRHLVRPAACSGTGTATAGPTPECATPTPRPSASRSRSKVIEVKFGGSGRHRDRRRLGRRRQVGGRRPPRHLERRSGCAPPTAPSPRCGSATSTTCR